MEVSPWICFVTILCLSYTSAISFPYVYPRIKLEARASSNAGEALMLTPYIKDGEIELAQNLSRVSLTEKLGFPSHAGFFTIDEQYNSNHYFWYFPSWNKQPDAPVVLWLQGGPGGTSLFGLFTELGPLVAKKNQFITRKYHWAINYNLIFIDNPVGTGFSFTDNEDGYCNDESCVGKGLYSSLQQFFTLFPELRKNDFYITGESYAGKYIPALGMVIHKENAVNAKKINLKGMAMGNAYCDPVNQMDYGNYLYQHGLLDDKQRGIFMSMQAKVAEAINEERWTEADIIMDRLMDGDISNTSYFKTFTGFDYYYNFLQTTDNEDLSVFSKMLQSDSVRKSVHVGARPFNDGKMVQLHLMTDILKSVASYVAELLSHYRILVYNGQLDIIVPYPLTESFLRELKFSGSDKYLVANRKIWRVDDEIAGYVKRAGNLTDALVRNAGHMVPHDQPKWAWDLITRFIKNDL